MAKYLADELNEKERTDFELQLAQNEELGLELEAYLNTWDLSQKPGQHSFDTQLAWQAVDKATTATKVVPLQKNYFDFRKIAAAILVLAVAGYFLITQFSRNDTVINPDFIEVASGTSDMKEFKLPDGTSVKLNANSKLSYSAAFGTADRNVTLTGEADFDVKRNENMPFIIEAGKGRIEVLGTSFDVAAYPGEATRLVVTEGKVAFSSMVNEEVEEILIKGQSAVIDSEGANIEVTETTSANFSGWWTRKLDFEDDPLSEVVESLQNTYWVKFNYDEDLKACPVSANFVPEQTITEVIEILEASFPSWKFDIKENVITLQGNACAD